MKLVITIVLTTLVVVGCYTTGPYMNVKEQIVTQPKEPAQIVKRHEETSTVQPPIIGRVPSIESKEAVILPAHPIPSFETIKQSQKLRMIPSKKAETKKTDDWIEQLQRATVALTVPEKSNIHDDVRVELLISLQKTADDLKKDLSESGQRYAEPLFVSRIVSATITAPDFEIKKVTPERQVLSASNNTTWLWTLRPKTSGFHKIDVGVTAIVTTNNKEIDHHMKTFKKTVEIEITSTQILLQWLSEYWEWLASTIVIPLLLWLYNLRRKRSSDT